jgi:uncharacterized protein (DUF4415 family)
VIRESRSAGKGWQTRVNDVMRDWIKALRD